MSAWRPIKTAPKGGTIILLAGGHDDNAEDVGDELAAFMRAPCRAMWMHDAWIIGIAEAGHVSIERIEPTHWMPLPEFFVLQATA